ncbi:MAG: hypothetical protein ACRD22_13460 [Terriglobia bacterium]
MPLAREPLMDYEYVPVGFLIHSYSLIGLLPKTSQQPAAKEGTSVLGGA